MRSYRYVAQNGDWTLTRPSGLRDIKEICHTEDETGAQRLHFVRNAEGTLLRRTEQNFVEKPWGWAITNKIEGLPGELRNGTTWSYFLDGPNRGKVSEKVEPNGNRIVYEYDAQNRVVRESMPLVDEENLYSYAPVDPSDPVLLRDTRPRCTVRKMQGIEIERTYYVYGTNGVDIVERVGEQGAAYGGTNVLRTVTAYYPVEGAVTDGLVQSIRHEDGTIDNYTYTLENGVWTETITHVHEEAPDIVPLRTTRSVRVYNVLGQLVDSRTDLYTAGVADLVPQADWTPIERLTCAYDVNGNEIRREDLAGRLWTSVWGGNCCGKISETDWQGITTTYAYDEEGRIVAKQGGTVLTETTYDALGRTVRVARRGIATADRPAATAHPATYAYDSLGRLTESEGEDGIRRVYAYAFRPEGGEIRTITEAPGTDCERTTTSISDAKNRLVQRFRSGGLRSTISRIPFGVNEFEGSKGTNSPVWNAAKIDMLGRVVESREPGFGATVLAIRHDFDSLNRNVSINKGYFSENGGGTWTDMKRQLFRFGVVGNRTIAAEDVNRNGLIDFSGPDVVVSNAECFVMSDGSLWRETSQFSFPDDNSAEPLRTFTLRTRLTGLGQAGETEFGTARLVMESKNIDIFGNESVQQAFSNRGSGWFITITTDPASIIPAWTFSMDGNVVSNRTTTGVVSARTCDALGRAIDVTDGRGNTTTLAYDAAGRVSSLTDATGATTSYAYDTLGRQIAVTNALGLVTTTAYDLDGNVVSQRGAQYPVDYTYDEYGRMTTMSTYRDEALAHPDVTTWLYDEATGLMTNKVYADGKGPTYDYTPDWQLSRRTWARGITTNYAYDSQGRLVAKTYSDATPNVSLTYDRLGNNLSAICEGVSTNLYAYNHFGQLTNEVQNGTTIARTYDALGRPTGYALAAAGESGDTGGPPADAGTSVSYAYDAFGRFASVTSGTNVFTYSYLSGSDLVSGMAANTGHAWERIYEPNRDIIASVHNRFGNRTISRFDSTNDELGRRSSRINTFDVGITTNTFTYNVRSEIVAACIGDVCYTHSYDSIGNRVSSTENGEDGVFETNELNQYISSERSGDMNEPTYDDDGNMTATGDGWHYEWNGENRMGLASNSVRTIRYAYDSHGRIVAKKIEGETRSLKNQIWDGWNILYEKSSDIQVFNIWGLDISSTRQGAGGVGGLLAVTRNKETVFPTYDENGNVTEYLDEEGTIIAHYEYGNHAIPIVKRGSGADLFSFTFSTKHYCEASELLEFELRSLHPYFEKWTSRDPIGEAGGFNLYSFLKNDKISKTDYLGRCVNAVLLGDSLTHGTESGDHLTQFKGIKDFLNIEGECSSRLEIGRGGLTIGGILNEFEKKKSSCCGCVAVVAFAGMNNVLQGMNRNRFKGHDPEPNGDLNAFVEKTRQSVISSALQEWNSLLDAVTSSYNARPECKSSFLFIHVWIPKITTTRRTNSAYAGDRWVGYINETIAQLNVQMMMAAGTAMAPIPIQAILSDVFVKHSPATSPDGDPQKIDDGVHFLDSSYENLARAISEAINSHNWEGCVP